MLIEGIDYFVREVPFPHGKTHGLVLLNDDGTYSVYIDANASEAQKIAALMHEITHLERDDLSGEKLIVEIECSLSRKEEAI